MIVFPSVLIECFYLVVMLKGRKDVRTRKEKCNYKTGKMRIKANKFHYAITSQ